MEISRSSPAIRVIMMPKDTNAMGTIFGGVILSYIDQAAAIQACKYASQRFVTKAMNAVEFKEPVHLGDVVSFYTGIVRVGRTSLTVKVDVEAERFDDLERTRVVKVTEAIVVCVAIDPKGRPTPVQPPSESRTCVPV